MDMFIDGQFTKGRGEARFDVRNPTDGSIVDQVPQAIEMDADDAIRSAKEAFDTWRLCPMVERVAIQKKCAQAMRDAAPEIGAVLHAELGRPLDACLGEITRSADLLDIYAEEGLRLEASFSLGAARGEKTVVTRDPVGVVIAITPFNYPITLLLFKLGAALISGAPLSPNLQKTRHCPR